MDAEYDREGVERARKRRDELGVTHMRPDLVMHRRGLSDRTNNLLFLEVKLIWRSNTGNPDDLDKVRKAVARQYQFGVVLGMTRPEAPTLFSPTWTVYALPLQEWRSDTSTRSKLLVEAAAIFNDATLAWLKEAADRVDQIRRRR